jgi:hypothetical protein
LRFCRQHCSELRQCECTLSFCLDSFLGKAKKVKELSVLS